MFLEQVSFYAMERGLKIPQRERTKTTNTLFVSLMKQLEKGSSARLFNRKRTIYEILGGGIEKENLCLYGHPNETWEVNLPDEEVPPELPEPALEIYFAMDVMNRRDWLSLIAVHSDCWLLSVAFYLGARLNRNERKRLFSLINDLPTVVKVVTERKAVKDKPNADSGSRYSGSTKFDCVIYQVQVDKLSAPQLPVYNVI